MAQKIRAMLVTRSMRSGKRKNGDPAVYYNLDLAIPGVGAGQVSVTEQIYDSVAGVAEGGAVDLTLGLSSWQGRLEGRVTLVEPVKG